jgi:hypothetical protein
MTVGFSDYDNHVFGMIDVIVEQLQTEAELMQHRMT